MQLQQCMLPSNSNSLPWCRQEATARQARLRNPIAGPQGSGSTERQPATWHNPPGKQPQSTGQRRFITHRKRELQVGTAGIVAPDHAPGIMLHVAVSTAACCHSPEGGLVGKGSSFQWSREERQRVNIKRYTYQPPKPSRMTQSLRIEHLPPTLHRHQQWHLWRSSAQPDPGSMHTDSTLLKTGLKQLEHAGEPMWHRVGFSAVPCVVAASHVWWSSTWSWQASNTLTKNTGGNSCSMPEAHQVHGRALSTVVPCVVAVATFPLDLVWHTTRSRKFPHDKRVAAWQEPIRNEIGRSVLPPVGPAAL